MKTLYFKILKDEFAVKIIKINDSEYWLMNESEYIESEYVTPLSAKIEFHDEIATMMIPILTLKIGKSSIVCQDVFSSPITNTTELRAVASVILAKDHIKNIPFSQSKSNLTNKN